MCLVFSLPSNARALTVTEIMYDAPGTDTGREWIEVYNETSDPLTFTDWKLFEDNSAHGISAARGDGVLAPGEYAVVTSSGVASLADYSSYTGDVYDSSFSLNNNGESFSFKTPTGSFEAQVTYVGGVLATGDGNSLHWISNQWTSRTPNPGGDPNSASGGGSVTNNQNTTGSGSGSNHQGTGTVPPRVSSAILTVPVYTMTIETNPKQPIARAPFTVTPTVIRAVGEESREYTFGILRIVTGDGRQIIRTKTEPVEFVYDRAGKYRLSIEYSQSSLPNKPLARYSADITIVDPTVVIGRDGSAITLTNESDEEVDVSGYIIRGAGHSIILSPGTVVLPNTTISVGSSSEILAHKPNIIELISADGKSKVSAREFVPAPVNNRTVVHKQVRGSRVQQSPSSENLPTETRLIVSPTPHMGKSELFTGVRDSSLVIYSDAYVSAESPSPAEQKLSITLPSAVRIESIKDIKESNSSHSLLILSVLSLVIASTGTTYLYLQKSSANAQSSSTAIEALRNDSEFGDSEGYTIVEK